MNQAAAQSEMNATRVARRALHIVVRVLKYIIQRLMFQTPYYRMTIEGFIFLAITLFIGFAAFNTDINLLYLILSIMCAFMIVHGVLSTMSLRPVEVERRLPRQFVAGQQGRVTIIVRNTRRFFQTYSLKISDYIQGERLIGQAFVMAVPSKGTVTTHYPCIFKKRGVYNFAHLKVSSRFPFGFFERSFFAFEDAHVIVYPKTIDIQKKVKVSADPFGEMESGRKGQGSSLHGLREYNVSDSARTIHWKVSARTEELIVREFEDEQRRRFVLILNNYFEGEISPELNDRFEKAVILCASMAQYLLKLGFQVQLVTASGRVPADAGRAQMGRILRSLAIVELGNKNASGARRLDQLNFPGSDATCVRIQYNSRDGASAGQSLQVLNINNFDWSDI